MIGKGFAIFRINSSPTAFYTIKTHLHYRDWFLKWAIIFKNCRNANPKICLRSCSCAEWWRHRMAGSKGDSKHSPCLRRLGR